MKTLEFQDALVRHPFARHNTYSYGQLTETTIYYDKKDLEIPYIVTCTTGEEIKYSNAQQFRGRILSTARLEEIFDSSHFPLKIKCDDRDFLIGKGFIGVLNAARNIEVLCIAYVPTNITISEISQVKFYVSRSAYDDVNKKVWPLIKNIINYHGGDVVITSKIDNYLGPKIPFPEVKTITERKKVIDIIVTNLVTAFKNGL